MNDYSINVKNLIQQFEGISRPVPNLLNNVEEKVQKATKDVPLDHNPALSNKDFTAKLEPIKKEFRISFILAPTEPLDLDSTPFVQPVVIKLAEPLDLQDTPFDTPFALNDNEHIDLQSSPFESLESIQQTVATNVSSTQLNQTNPSRVSKRLSLLPSNKFFSSTESTVLSSLHQVLNQGLDDNRKLRFDAANQTFITTKREAGLTSSVGKSKETTIVFNQIFSEIKKMLEDDKAFIFFENAYISVVDLLKQIGRTNWGKEVIKNNVQINKVYTDLLNQARHKQAVEILGDKLAYSSDDFLKITKYVKDHKKELGKTSSIIDGQEIGVPGKVFFDGKTKSIFALSEEKEYELGAGKSQIVWAGVNVKTGEPVAIGRDFGDTIARDANLSIAQKFVDHPSFVKVFNTFEQENGTFYAVYEFCEGGDCAALLQNKELVLSAAQKNRMAYDIMSAINKLHKNGIAHRDVFASNFLLKDGFVLSGDHGESVFNNEREAKKLIQEELKNVGALLYQIYIDSDDLDPETQIKFNQLKTEEEITNHINRSLAKKEIERTAELDVIIRTIVDLAKPQDRISVDEALTTLQTNVFQVA